MRILIIDDDETTLLIAQRRLANHGHEVDGRSEAIGTTNAIRAFAPDVVLLDVGMPAMSGYSLAKLISTTSPSTKLVLFSSRDRAELAAQAKVLGAAGYIHKDDGAELAERLDALLEPKG